MGGGAGATAALGWVLGLGLGCEGQADPSYAGEPLVSLGGQVESALSVGDVEVGILWLTAESDFDLVCTGESTPSRELSACVAACGEVTCETLESWGDCALACPDVTEVLVDARTTSMPFVTGGVGVTTPVVGEFPAQFSLDILEPPPAEALIGSATGERLAIGIFVALDPAGAPWRIDLSQGVNYPDWLLGGSESHLLLYTPDVITESSIWSQALAPTLPTGYTLLESLPLEEEEEGEDARPVPDADAASVLLRIAPPDSIEWPLGLF
jgi:hypothetical protein